MTAGAEDRQRLMRRLALEKLRELRLAGLSYSEIGRRYGEGVDSEPREPEPRLPFVDPLFARTLDALRDGLAFFDLEGSVIHLNRTLDEALGDEDGEQLRAEIHHFAATLASIVRRRVLNSTARVEIIAARRLHHGELVATLRGSYIGVDLFGAGGTLLVTVEATAQRLMDPETMKARFGLSAREVEVARWLASGASNLDIARRLFISVHTVRHHTENILLKLGVRSRRHVAECLTER